MSKPRILMLDIETAPAVAYVWQLWDVNSIGLDQLVAPGRTICASWQWLGSSKVEFGAEWDAEGKDVFLRRLHEDMSKADAIITYNGDKFDLPKLNGEFIQLGLAPPAPSASIDLRTTVKKLGFTSGKLAHVGPLLRVGSKVKHEGFSLWADVLKGEPRAQAKMERYNKQDTRLLGKLYKRLLPYIKNHPYLHDTPPTSCPSCGSNKTQHRGVRRTKSFSIERIQCQGCGSWFDGKRTKMGGNK